MPQNNVVEPLSAILKGHLDAASLGLTESWFATEIFPLSDEKVYLIRLAHSNIPAPESGEGINLSEEEMTIHAEQLLGWQVWLRVKKRYTANKGFDHIRKLHEPDQIAISRLSAYFKELPSIKKCRSAAQNLFSLPLNIFIFCLMLHPFLRHVTPWPEVLSANVPAIKDMASESLCILVAIVLIVQVLRVTFGLNFMDFDNTYSQALAGSKRGHWKSVFERFGRLSLYGAGIVLPLSIRTNFHLGLYIAWFVLTLVPLTYIIIFWKELTNDTDKKRNYFMMGGDILFVTFSMLLFPFWNDLIKGYVHFVWFAAVLFWLVFVLEVILVYLQSIKTCFRLTRKFFQDPNLR